MKWAPPAQTSAPGAPFGATSVAQMLMLGTGMCQVRKPVRWASGGASHRCVTTAAEETQLCQRQRAAGLELQSCTYLAVSSRSAGWRMCQMVGLSGRFAPT